MAIELNKPRADSESGFVLLAVIAVLLPLVGLVGAAILTMGGRTNRLMEEVRQEKALLAAESGIDEAGYRGAIGTLTDGVSISRTLPGGASFTVTPTHLLTDGVDNDGDGDTDEPDEDVFQILVIGVHGNARRYIVGYLSRVPGTLPIESATTLFNQNPQINISFLGPKAFITGIDHKMNGGLGTGAPVYGLSIQAPGTVADLIANYIVDDDSQIKGLGGAPSLGVSTSSMDLDLLVKEVQTKADIHLKPNYAGQNWGTGPAGDFKLFHRNGNLTLTKTVIGAGIMVVTGNLKVSGTFEFDGIIIVLGDVELNDHVRITGALIQGPASGLTQFTSSPPRHVMITYSTEVIAAVSSMVVMSAGGNFSRFSGWQEIGRN